MRALPRFESVCRSAPRACIDHAVSPLGGAMLIPRLLRLRMHPGAPGRLGLTVPPCAGITFAVIRSPNRVLPCVALVLASILVGPHGVGTRVSEDDCTCAAAAALEDVERSSLQLGGETEDSCPPGCDCPCCGGPGVSATAASGALGPVGSIALAAVRNGPRSAPAGERAGVFRPPRA